LLLFTTAQKGWNYLLTHVIVEVAKALEATQTLQLIKADPQTNAQTDSGDYNTLRSLARSVITLVAIRWGGAVDSSGNGHKPPPPESDTVGQPPPRQNAHPEKRFHR